MGGFVLGGFLARPTRLFSSGAPSVEALRAKNAAHLFPKRERQEAMELLDQLTSVLDANAESAWARCRDMAPGQGQPQQPQQPAAAVTLDILPGLHADEKIAPPAKQSYLLPGLHVDEIAPPAMAPPKQSYLDRARAASLLQARTRGRQARARGRKARGPRHSSWSDPLGQWNDGHAGWEWRRATGRRSSSSSDAVSSACFPSPIDLRPRPTPRNACAIALLGLPLLLFALVAFPWLVAAALLGYAYLRLPRLLGWAVSQAVTRFGLFGYPLTLGAIHLSPWLELRPARLRLRLYVEDFSLSNPPSLGCPHRHFVSAGAVDFLLTIDLHWARELLVLTRDHPRSPEISLCRPSSCYARAGCSPCRSTSSTPPCGASSSTLSSRAASST